MKRVLQFAYGLNSGGIEAFVTNLNSCRNIFSEPFDFLLYSSSEHKDFYEDANTLQGSKIYKLGDYCSSIFWISCIQKRIRAYRFMKKNHYDVVHIHNSNAFCILEAVLAKAAGVSKVIVHSHNTTMGGRGGRKIIKLIVQFLGQPLWPLFADEYCACSTEAGIWMFGKKAAQKGKVHVLRNGIIGEKYYFDPKTRGEYRVKMGWDENYVIGHVGRFTKQKNHTFLLDIFLEIHKREPKARLILFGNGELYDEIKKKAELLGIKEFINFYGVSDKISEWFQALDLYLFPSLYEGLPVSGIEAQAAGLPILAADTISPELKITDTIQWMSLNEKAEKWAEKALDMLYQKKDRNTKARIQAAGYDIVSTAMELKEIYDK